MMQPAANTPAQNSAYIFTPPCGVGQVKIQTTTKPVTPFAGVAALLAWFQQLGLVGRFAELMPFAYKSPNAIPTPHTLLAFILSVILGGSRFAHCDWLRHDRALHALMGIPRFPGKDAIRNFFHRFGQGETERFWRPLWLWLIAKWKQPFLGFTMDLDSTIFQREGSQEGALKGYNPKRKGRPSHHPLLACLAEAPLILHAWLRSGNASSARGAPQFLKEAMTLLPAGWRLRCVRADSGFFSNELLTALESLALRFIVVAKMTCQIKSNLRSISHWRALDDDFCVGEFAACLQDWSQARRFVVVREKVREKGEGKAAKAKGRKLLDVPGYTYRVFVTNSAEPAEIVWRDYNQRATMEQRIEELKNDLHVQGFCTQDFFATESAFLAATFAFNLLSTFQSQTMEQEGYRQPATLRAAVFIAGAVLGREGHNTVLRVSADWGGSEKLKPLIDKALDGQRPIAALLPLAGLPDHDPTRRNPWGGRLMEPREAEP